MIKFNTLDDFLGSSIFLSKNLEDIDLSNLDLSGLDEETWYYFSFNNVDFSNTNINLDPTMLACRWDSRWIQNIMTNCNFTNCDFSNWEDGYLDNADFSGCNFTNTKLHIKIRTKFNNSFEYRDFSKVNFGSEYTMDELKEFLFCFNSDTLEKYPDLELSLEEAYMVASKYFIIDEYIYVKSYCELHHYDYEQTKKDIIWLKNFDKSHGGILESILNTLKDACEIPFDENNEDLFYLGYVSFKNFNNLDFTKFPEEIIRHIKFVDCSFNFLHIKSYFNITEYYSSLFSGCEFQNIIYDDITFDSWKKGFLDTRFADSHATIKVNTYVELGRACNANCEFCRNKYLDNCDYDLDKIIYTTLHNPIHNITIGGGEPTLLFDDLKRYIKKCRYISKSHIDKSIITNATDYDKLSEIGYYLDAIYISRHAVSDIENNQIIGAKTLTKDEIRDLKDDVYSSLILVCTCFSGKGVDSLAKMIEYLKFAIDVNANSILFQTFHQDLKEENKVTSVSDDLFDKMINYLYLEGFAISQSIYSTGNYKLIIAKNKSMSFKKIRTISFKKYISEEELLKNWYKASKRTFDLSIAPDGSLYQNWHQSSGRVLKP